MKLLYDYEIFSRQRYGGISRYFFELIRSLCEKKIIDIDLFLGVNNSGYDFGHYRNRIKTTEFKFRTADKIHLALQPINKFWFNRFASSQKFDLFHKTYYSNSGLGLKCPLISTIHDMTHELLPGYFAAADNTSKLKKLSVKRSDGIICVSETTKKDLVECFKVDPAIIRVIYHGITLKANPDAEKIISSPYLLYVGQRWGYKNFKVLLKAYLNSEWLNRSFDIVCFGGGTSNLSEKLFIKENNLENRIHFLTGNDDILVSLYTHASALVYTSLYEGFGFPPVEAMECGCPVLTSPAGSIKEIAGDSAAYFDPNEPEELITQLKKIIDDPELRAELVKKGKQRVTAFNWDVSADKHLEFYKEISNKLS